MGLDENNKLAFRSYHLQWMKDNKGKVQDYLNSCVNNYSINEVYGMFQAEPWMCRIVVQDYMDNCRDIKYNLNRTIGHLTSPGNELSAITGSKGSGKTHQSIAMTEKIHNIDGANKVWIGMPNHELEAHKWTIAPSIRELDTDDYGNQDEMAIFTSSRRAMSKYNNEFIEYLPTLRHKDIAGLSILTQSTKRMDNAILEYCSTHIIKNYTDAYSMNVERGIISDDMLLEFLKPRADYIIKSPAKAWSYVKTGGFSCLMYTEKVDWYNDKIGKAFGKFNDEKQALDFAVAMFKAGDYDVEYVRKAISNKGFNKDKKFWQNIKDQVEEGIPNNPGITKAQDDLKMCRDILGTDGEAEQYIEKLKKKERK